MVFHKSFSDSESPQVSRTILNIPIDLINALVWIVSTRRHISKSSNPCTNHLVIISSAAIIIDIINCTIIIDITNCTIPIG